ncbi:MAG: hypothetical protein AAB556_01140 [Patescibacteria group bacterium]
MTPEKVLEVIGVYRRFFESCHVPKVKLSEKDFDKFQTISFNEKDKKAIMAHCHQMLDTVEEFVRDKRMDKCFRWLGFIQGCLLCGGMYTLNELKNHSRPNEEK